MKTNLTSARLAFPALFTAKTMQNSDSAKFGASLIVAADDKQIKTINEVIETVAKEKWGAKAADVLKQLRASDKVCLHNGDVKAAYDGFAGNFFISATNSVRPLVVDKDKSPLTEADGKPYSGCYVNAVLEIWAQDNQFGKRINATLMGVQFVKDGEAFGGGGRPADVSDFDDISSGADAEALV